MDPPHVVGDIREAGDGNSPNSAIGAGKSAVRDGALQTKPVDDVRQFLGILPVPPVSIRVQVA